MSLANWTTRLLGTHGAAQAGDGLAAGGSDAEPGGATLLNPARHGDLVGTRVGAYLINKRIGAGGVGEVYKAVDTMLNRDVAIKVLRDELASDPVFLARFRNEAHLQAKLSHANIAAVHAFVQEGDKQLLVMEYVPGIALDEFVRSGGPVPVPRALEIFRRVLDGIDHAHGHGIVHRDIKPANIMLADSGQVKVMDFGIARAMDSHEHLTRFGHVAGTAKAMSPEQIRGKQADVRSDVYSLGIVLYTLLAGRAPFDGGNDVELMKAQLEQAPPALNGSVDGLPPKVEAAVMRALEKDPGARFQTVRDFARAIDACIAEAAPAAAPSMPDRSPDAGTASRTAINPALQGLRRLPSGGAAPARRVGAKGPRPARAIWVRASGIALAVAAIAGATVLLWSQFSPKDQPSVAAPKPPAISPRQPAEPPVAERSRPGAPVADAPAPVRTVSAAPGVPTPPPSAILHPAPAAAPAETVLADNSAPSVGTVLPRTLSIVRLGSNGKAAPAQVDPAHRFQPGERVRLQVVSSNDAYVYCYLQDETRRIQRFFPNRFSKSALVKAGVPLEIPGKMRFELVANSLKVPETVACYASERDLVAELPASVVGNDFAKLPAGSLDEVGEAFRRAAPRSLTEGRFRIAFE